MITLYGSRLFHNIIKVFQLCSPAARVQIAHGYLIFWGASLSFIARTVKLEEEKSESGVDVKWVRRSRHDRFVLVWRMCCGEAEEERERKKGKKLSFAIHWREARRSVWYVRALCNSTAIIFGETMGAVVQRTTSAQPNIQLKYYLFFSQKSNHMVIYVDNPIKVLSSWLAETDGIYFLWFYRLQISQTPNRIPWWRAYFPLFVATVKRFMDSKMRPVLWNWNVTSYVIWTT